MYLAGSIPRTMQDKEPLEVGINDVDVNYSFRSSLGAMEDNRYRQKIIGDIIYVNDVGDKIGDIGKVSASKLLMDTGFEGGWDTFSICDVEQLSMDIGQIVYDFKKNDWNESLEKHFDIIFPINLLIFESIEIKTEFDYLDVDKYVVKDVYNNFIQGAGLYVLNCWGLVKGNLVNGADHQWKLNRSYSKLVKNRKSPLNKVISYYEKAGFQLIPELSFEFMFLCPDRGNKRFKKIELG